MAKLQAKIGTREILDPSRRCEEARQFENTVRAKVVGQNAALETLVEIYQTFLAGLQPPSRPVANLLFLGPTGSGKTRTVEAMAETLFGDSRAVIKVDCAEFQHSHEIAKLIGSPPGYLGHRETHPVLTQEALNQWHTDRCRLSLVLFDEIEKASDALWQLLLGILDRATLTLGDNRRVDFSQAMIFMTSNLGAAEMSNLVDGGLGFNPPASGPSAILDGKVDRVAVEAARRKFSPEFMNRIDKTVVFHNLRAEDLSNILEIELARVQQRILAANGPHPFLFQCTSVLKDFLLHEGYDPKYGARHLKRAIERNLVSPLAKLMATGQVKLGDMVRIDLDPAGHMQFTREAEGVLTPMYRESFAAEYAAAAPAGRRNGNRRMDFPLALETK
ncbi:MAG: AAA family ATPase [Terriglobales bacterium]